VDFLRRRSDVYCKIITIIITIESSFPGCELPLHSLQITGPAQGPRVDKPHLASIARIRPAVTGRALKDIAKVVRNGSGVADWHNRKFTQDMLDGNNIKNRLFVVKLVNYLRANRSQPSCIIQWHIHIIKIISIIIL
jgi:hypothetical protein